MWGTRHVRAAFDYLGYYAAGAAFLFVVAILGLLVVLQSPDDMLLWNGTQVAGTEQGGVVTYHWGQENYSFAVPGLANKSHVTVYINPSKPSHGVTNSVGNRVLDGLLTVVPLTGGIVVIIIGAVRRRQADRNRIAMPSGYGRGLDPTTVDRLLEKARQPPPTRSG